jgi:F1F0 ATPase subunit 2
MTAGPMTVTVLVSVAFAAGTALGWIFYAGLYRTVRTLGSTRHPALLVGGSLLLRILLLVAGLWALLVAGERWIGHGWLALLPGLLGVMAARTLLLRRYGRPGVAPGGSPRSRRESDLAKRQAR